MSVTLFISSWLLLILFGTYATFGIPIRLDHVLFPLIGSGVYLFACFRQKKIILPKILLPYIGFLLIAMAGTFLALSSEGFLMRPVSLLAALENHYRILLIFLTAYSLGMNEKIDINKIIKILLLASAILGIFAFFQVCRKPYFIHDFIRNLTYYCYTGRSDRGISMSAILTGIRAVSTFYLPGNYALFCSIMLSILLAAKEDLKFSSYLYYGILFLNLTGLFFTASKGFFSTMFILSIYLVLSKKWKELFLTVFLLTIVSVLAYYSTEQVITTYKSYAMQSGIRSYYNQFLGGRFGSFVEVKDNGRENEAQQETELDSVEAKIESVSLENIEKAEHERSKKEELETVPHLEESKENVVPDEEEKEEVIKEKGNLSGALDVFRSRPFFGVGYISNVNSGDSMFVHLLVRGGILGFSMFTLFLFVISYGLFKDYKTVKNKIAISWILMCLIFFIGGIGYPTFIQDRSGDIFWWLGAMLVFSKKELLNEIGI